MTHLDGLRFWPNSQPFQAIQTDSGAKRPWPSAFAATADTISSRRASWRNQGKRVNTSATWRTSYQTRGALSLAKSVPMAKR